MLFADKIRSLREEKKMLQRELAAALSVDTPMYSRIERGERPIKREQIKILADLLCADESELLKDSDMNRFMRNTWSILREIEEKLLENQDV